jgi:hypothetical protein
MNRRDLNGIAAAMILLLPAAALPQMPPQQAKLVIYSAPSGALITINNREMQQRTNATFIVSPGTYSVAVQDTDAHLSCANPSVQLSSGQTLVLTCTSSGWR